VGCVSIIKSVVHINFHTDTAVPGKNTIVRTAIAFIEELSLCVASAIAVDSVAICVDCLAKSRWISLSLCRI
jgi:hypothetical protein